VGSAVALAERAGKRLNELAAAELLSLDRRFGADALAVFDLKQAMARRNLPGAPGTREVRKQLVRWRKILHAERKT
jgi:argininosuccinate lyase